MVVEFTCFSVALLFLSIQLARADPPTTKPNCQPSCGNITISYPFGMGNKDCYLNDWFEIDCDKNVYPHRPFLRRLNMEVVDNINAEVGATVRSPISSKCSGLEGALALRLAGSPFYISNANSFIAVGCSTRALLVDEPLLRIGCDSRCHGEEDIDLDELLSKLTKTDSVGYNYIGQDCNGTRCCKIQVPSPIQGFKPVFKTINGNQSRVGCKVAFLAADGGYPNVQFPLVLDWTINSTVMKDVVDSGTANCSNYNAKTSQFQCYCNSGFEGNPYIGCTDINECKPQVYNPCHRYKKCVNTYGSYKCVPDPKWVIIIVVCGAIAVLATPFVCWRIYKLIKKIRSVQLRKKFFKRNGGLLLQQQLTSADGNIHKIQIFSSKELEKATDRFSENRILGQGGQGTVYKGMLTDGRIVAIKKSKLVDEEKVQEFINELVILSQINHRNVVSLLGCCLETEVPLLVYEFISNGSLFHYLHDQTEETSLTWEMRLRIASEVAGALAYLHSAASIPVYHRDIKSTNVLLDEKNKAKVSDFGTSRSISIDQTHLTTRVQGTFGYLDPEYYQTSKFTDKSDVYSFGVVLVELLSGQKPIYSSSSKEITSLAAHFVVLMEENRLFDIVDTRIVECCPKEEILKVADLAERCLHLNGRKRPTMIEVAMELLGIQALRKKLNIQQDNDEIEDASSDDVSISHSCESCDTLCDDIAITVSFD